MDRPTLYALECIDSRNSIKIDMHTDAEYVSIYICVCTEICKGVLSIL